MPTELVKIGLLDAAFQVPIYCNAPCKLDGICESGIVPEPSKVATPFDTPALRTAEVPSPRFALASETFCAPVPPCVIDQVGHV